MLIFDFSYIIVYCIKNESEKNETPIDNVYKNITLYKPDIFIIYLPRILCLSYSCHIPVCRCCGTLSYSLCFSNQTGQGDETEGLEREGYRGRDRRGSDWRGRVWIDFSLLKAQPKKNVGSQCHLQLLCWTV